MRHGCFLMLLMVLVGIGQHSRSHGNETSSDQAGVESQAKSSADDSSAAGSSPFDSPVKQSLSNTPWYDAEAGRVRPIQLKPRDDDSAHRDSRWLPKPKKIKQSNSQSNNAATGTGGNGSNQGLFGTSFTLGNVLGWILLIVIVMALAGGAVYAISRAEMAMSGAGKAGSAGSGSNHQTDEQLLERIKHLPPELRRTDVDLRSECERLMGEGQFDQAIILLFGHQLLLLDQHGLLRLSRGKTNNRYVRETRMKDSRCATWLRQTADAFEHSYFGRHEIPSEIFQRLWTQNESMELAVDTLGETR